MPEPTAIAVAALVRDGRLLMAHRHPGRAWYPDCWDLVGGHIEPGESPEQAVRRECLEEIAVWIHEPRPISLATNDPTIAMHAFVAERWDGEPVNAAPDEHNELAWFTPDELMCLTLPDPVNLPDLLRVLQG